jgi:hypothetical protein
MTGTGSIQCLEERAGASIAIHVLPSRLDLAGH